MEPTIQAKTVVSYLSDVAEAQRSLGQVENPFIRVGELGKLLDSQLQAAFEEASEVPEPDRTALHALCWEHEALVWQDIAIAYEGIHLPEFRTKLQGARLSMMAALLRALQANPSRVEFWPWVAEGCRLLRCDDARLGALAECLRSGSDEVVVQARKELGQLGKRPAEVAQLTFDLPAVLDTVEETCEQHQQGEAHQASVKEAKQKASAAADRLHEGSRSLGNVGCGMIAIGTVLGLAGSGKPVGAIGAIAAFLGIGLLVLAGGCWVAGAASAASGWLKR